MYLKSTTIVDSLRAALAVGNFLRAEFEEEIKNQFANSIYAKHLSKYLLRKSLKGVTANMANFQKVTRKFGIKQYIPSVGHA